MTIKEMHLMRTKGILPRTRKKTSPLAREIEIRKEEMIRGILNNVPKLINQQLKLSGLPVIPGSKDNDTVLKSSNSLLDRALGKPKETVDLNTTVKFSLVDLAKQRDAEVIELPPLEDAIE